MTDFVRARSEEQKQARMAEIKAAADSLFNSVTYQEITLSTIAGKLTWTRANLYKYVTTKEEIYLEICSDKMHSYFDDLFAAFRPAFHMLGHTVYVFHNGANVFENICIYRLKYVFFRQTAVFGHFKEKGIVNMTAAEARTAGYFAGKIKFSRDSFCGFLLGHRYRHMLSPPKVCYKEYYIIIDSVCQIYLALCKLS